MPEHEQPLSEHTVRMDAGRSSGPPPLTGSAAQETVGAPAAAAPQPSAPAPDDTRPVGRDWMRGEPAEAGPSTTASAPATVLTADDDWGSAAEQTLADAWPPIADDDTVADGGYDATAFAPIDSVATDNDETARHAPFDDGTGYDSRGDLPLGRHDDDGPRRPGSDGPGGPGDRGPGVPGRPWWRRRVVLVPAATVAVLGAAYGVDLLIAGGDVPRHTVVGGVDIGGLSPSAASSALRAKLAPSIAADRTVVAADVRSTFSPKAAGLGLDVPATVAAAGSQPLDPWTRLTTLFSDRTVAPVLQRNSTDLTAEIAALAAKVDKAPVEATIALDGTSPSVVQPADGRHLDRGRSASAITAALVHGGHRQIRLPVAVSHPHVTAAEAQKILDGTVTPALASPVTVVSQDGRKRADIAPTAIAAALTFTPQADGDLVVAVDPAKLQAAVGDDFATFGSPAKDAGFKVTGNSITVVPSVDGSGVDPAKLATQVMNVLTQPAPRSVTAELGPVPAAFTTAQADAMGIKEQIGSFTTNFAASPSATNIRVVAAKVNGAVVKAGETFSLNTFTGVRGTAQGYVPAGVIEGGKFTTAVGGGISQFATTMFNAEFFAGVQDIHHQPHSYWISRYPAGREATVFDGQIDLAWKNDADTGIYIQTAWTPSSITVTFWGTKHYDIESVSGDRRNVLQPAVQEVPDDGTCKPQAGMEGFDITVTRVFKDLHGGVLRKQDFHTHYKAEPVIRCVPAAAPAGTTAPAPTGSGRRPAPPAEGPTRRPTGRRRRS
jgi:vancomycin resistance protein YoaR